ncbi:MAG: GNAT family N-acetyltransferase [DPANN group archaeon]|nr:GNAT family N-acetyltransferase [DPANN group archaeon]
MKKYKQNIKKAISDNNTLYLIAYEDNKPVGFCESYIKNDVGILSSTFIILEYRNKGIVKVLFNMVLNWFNTNNVKIIKTNVYSNNIIALTVWKSMGFKEIGTDKKCVFLEYCI